MVFERTGAPTRDLRSPRPVFACTPDQFPELTATAVPGEPARAKVPLTAPVERYIRIIWRAATPLLAPVQVKAAMLNGATLAIRTTCA